MQQQHNRCVTMPKQFAQKKTNQGYKSKEAVHCILAAYLKGLPCHKAEGL